MDGEAEKLLIKNYTDEEEGFNCAFISNIGEAAPHPHTHDFFELMLVYEGKAVHYLNGGTHILTEGMLIFIRPQDEHCLCELKGCSCRFINLAFPVETLYELADYLGEGFNVYGILNAAEPPVARLDGVERNVLRQKLESFNLLPVSQKKVKKMGIRAMLAGIITNHFTGLVPAGGSRIPGWLNELCLAMNSRENLADGIKALVMLSGKSHEHLCRVFVKFLGLTPTEFVTGLRLNYAANLLLNSDMSILDISMEAGYESLSRFYSLFGARFGTTPAQYRQQGRQGGSII
jgi:AraC family cel operon transcriptional repressor